MTGTALVTGLIELVEALVAEVVRLGWRVFDMLWPGALDLLPNPWGER